MAKLTDKIPKGFGKLPREEQERILVERVGMHPHMARERVAMIRGEIEGDIEYVDVPEKPRDDGRGRR